MHVLKSIFHVRCLDAAVALDPCHSSLAMSSSSPAASSGHTQRQGRSRLRSKNKINLKRTQVVRDAAERKELAPL